MNKPGCPCGAKEKSPRTSPYENNGYGPSQDGAPHVTQSGTGCHRGVGPARRPPCGPKPCGRQTCPIPKPAPQPVSLPEEGHDNDEGPKGFEMNNATWSLCAAVTLFCCGVYLTKKMAIVATELG